MAPEKVSSDSVASADWRVEAVRQAFRQGLPAVFSLLMLYGVYRVVDYLTHEGIDRIQAGYREVIELERANRATERQAIADTLDALHKVFRDQTDALRENSRINAESQRLLDRIYQEMRVDARAKEAKGQP